VDLFTVVGKMVHLFGGFLSSCKEIELTQYIFG
jgi:hypothetical protein